MGEMGLMSSNEAQTTRDITVFGHTQEGMVKGAVIRDKNI